jgi:hypothetical protein
MGVGRREFLRLAGLALAGLTISPLKAVAVNRNYYVNKKFGIMFEKPEDWGFVLVTDYEKHRNAQILPEEITEEQKRELAENPAFIVTKYWQDTPEYIGRFSPTIIGNIQHKSELGFEFTDFEHLIGLSGHGMGHLLKDFQITGGEGPFLISNCKAYIRTAHYLFEHIEMREPVRTNMKTLMIEHKDYYYFISMHDSEQANETTQEEFDNFMQTIKLV